MPFQRTWPRGNPHDDHSRDDPPADLPPALRLFSVRQVAGILQLQENSVRKLIYEGRLEARRVGISIRVAQDALERFLEENPCREPDGRRDPRRGRGGCRPRQDTR